MKQMREVGNMASMLDKSEQAGGVGVGRLECNGRWGMRADQGGIPAELIY